MGTGYSLGLFFLSSMMLSATQVIHVNAMQFKVINHARGTKVGSEFEKKITVAHAIQVMEAAYDLVLSKVYKLDNPFPKNKIDEIALLVVENDSPTLYESNGFLITGEYLKRTHFNLRNFDKQIYTAMSHLFLSMDEDNDYPEELKEAIVEFVLLEAGHADQITAKPGDGKFWYENRDVTAQFFKHCDTQEPEFVAKMIKNMKKYSSDYLRKNVDPLWKPYRNFYRRGYGRS